MANYSPKQQKSRARGRRAEDRVLGILNGGSKPSWIDQTYKVDTYTDSIGIDLIVRSHTGADYYLQVKSSRKMAQTFRKKYESTYGRQYPVAVIVAPPEKDTNTIRQQAFYLLDQMRTDTTGRVIFTLPSDASWRNYTW